MAPPVASARIRALSGQIDPHLKATLDRLTPLTYTTGAFAPADLPPFVRAASAVRRFGSHLLVVQDDINALALLPATEGPAEPLLLPRGNDGRRRFDDGIGNKRLKLDLEACAALADGRLVIFGSGSSPARETLILIAHHELPVILPAPRLYAALRAEPSFAGAELNLEGALVANDELLLFQRGNGGRRSDVDPVTAIGAFDLAAFTDWLRAPETTPVPALRSVLQLDLGVVSGCAYSVTDAARSQDGRIVMLACAERSVDAVSDGPVVGCRVAVLAGDQLTLVDIRDETGKPCLLKLEGIEPHPESPERFDVVVDVDRHDQPAQLGRLRISSLAAPRSAPSAPSSPSSPATGCAKSTTD